jgi:hypothetical protein
MSVNRSLYARLPEETRSQICILAELSRQVPVLNAPASELVKRAEKRAKRRKRHYDRALAS